ncbi:MAG: PQQ-like beta-propeller repeat protein [Planctomycetota bacterium]|nr:PQQ-like beta-propeller repeat protein [Planctomycetota bacterium]
MRSFRTVVSLGLVCAGLLPAAEGADWLRFRGPNGLGTSDARNLPSTWSDTQGIVWKTELAGPGASSPIVVGDRIFVTSFRGVSTDKPGDLAGLEYVLTCLDRKSGKLQWQQVEKAKPGEDRYEGFLAGHGYASNTPTSDGQRVFTFYGKSGVHAYTLAGEKLWSQDVGNGSAPVNWGTANSPIIYKDKLIVPATSESKSLIAFNVQTGKEEWKLTADGFYGTWSTPGLVTLPSGKQELVIAVPYEIWGIDPDNGAFLWYSEGVKEDVVCTSPVIRGDMVYVVGGRNGSAVAVQAGGKDEVTKTHMKWSKSIGSYVTSPVIHGDHLYWVSDRGIAICLALADGATVYQSRIPDGGQMYASVLVADNKLYAVTRQNGTFVVAAKPEFELLQHVEFAPKEEVFNGSPAVTEGRLLFRSDRFLYCVGK